MRTKNNSRNKHSNYYKLLFKLKIVIKSELTVVDKNDGKKEEGNTFFWEQNKFKTKDVDKTDLIQVKCTYN